MKSRNICSVHKRKDEIIGAYFTLFESACGMVEDFSQTERATRVKLSYYAKEGQKEMLV